MVFDPFGFKKRENLLKARLKDEIRREILNAESSAYLPGWEERQKKSGRSPQVSYKNLQALYKKESWVRACVDAISRTATSNGYRLVSTDPRKDTYDASKLPAVAPIVRLLERPNPDDTFTDILAEIIVDLHLYGDAYLEIVRGRAKKPIALFNIYAPSMRALVNKHGKVLGYIQIPDGYISQNQKLPMFKPEDIVHFRLPNPGNAVYGLSPLESLATAIETDLWAQTYNKKFFQNNATPRLHVDLGNCTLPQLKRTREYFATILKGAENAHKTLVTEGGAKIEPIGVQPKDMEFLNQRKFSRDEICAVFGVPPMKIGIFEDVNRASATESDKSFKSEKIIPLQRMIAKKLNQDVISQFKGARVQFEFVELDLRDAKEQAEIDQIKIESGVLTVDEVRRRDGLPPLPDDEKPEEDEQEAKNVGNDIRKLNKSIKTLNNTICEWK